MPYLLPKDASLVHTGTGLMVAASVVCVVAAVTNDRYFPEARMSQKEAKVLNRGGDKTFI